MGKTTSRTRIDLGRWQDCLENALQHSIYGLSVSSDITLVGVPFADTAGEPPSIKISSTASGNRNLSGSGWFATSLFPNGEVWLRCARLSTGFLLSYEGLADFEVDSSGTSVMYRRAAAGVSDLTISALLLDNVLPLVLNLRGLHALHATAVTTPAGVFAFL